MLKFPYPENPALTDAPLLEPIKRRWSPLAFSSDPIEPEKINALFEAARWTQSSRNEQPWRIIYATKDDSENFDRLGSFLTEDNAYAKEAFLLFMVCAFPTFPNYQNKSNRMHQYDTGAAIQSLIIQAVSMGLITHQMGGFDKERPYVELGIPTDVPLMTMVAIGYPGDERPIDPQRLEERYQEHQQRKPVSDFAFKGKWKN